MAQPATVAGYQPRSATNPLKEIVEENLDELFRVWDERFAATYGFLQARLRELFERFLRCGDPHYGFLRLVCTNAECGENRYVPHSCKIRGLCPSCGQKRAVAWAERLVEGVLPDLPYLQLVFTIPKILRKAFLFKRELYGELSWFRLPPRSPSPYAATRDFYREHFPALQNAVPAMLVVPQSFGSLLNAHPHLHSLASNGVFDQDGNFHPCPEDLDFSPLVDLFRERTFKMLLQNEATTEERVQMIRSWRHCGFNVDSRRRIQQGERAELEKLLQYIQRPPVSLERLRYDSDGMVTYKGHFHPGLRRDHQLVSGLEFLAMLVPHILLRYECQVRYYGALSTKIRLKFGWLESKQPPQPSTDDEDSEFVRTRRKNWARLISKVFLEDPELCPKCGKRMKVIAAISSPAQDDVIEKILRSIGVWDPPWKRIRRARGPPRQTELFDEDSSSQLPAVEEEDLSQELPGQD